MRKAILNGTIIAWDGLKHHVVNSGTVVFKDNSIEFVGGAYDGSVDETIDATGRLVIPGLVNSHLHVTDTLFTKGHLEETQAPVEAAVATNYHALYTVLPEVRHATDADAQVAAAQCVFAELAKTGSTTVVELGYDFEIGGDADIAITERVADVAGASGLRCYSGPRFRSYYYSGDGRGGTIYRDYGVKAETRFEECVEFCATWNGRYQDRLRTLLAPGQIDTCSPAMLRETRRLADQYKLPIHIHAGQSLSEFNRIYSTMKRTTVEYMMDTGLLGPDFIIGHGQIMSGDGDQASMGAHEISALRDSGTTICHLPWVKARRGGVINSIEKYKEMGIRQCLGTDTYPFDMFNDMRFASVICKIVERNASTGLSTDVFHMATVGGADALSRPDIGRLRAGCKADIVMIRIDTPKAAPVYDPFKFLVHAANGEDVDMVIVDGKTIVEAGHIKTIDVEAAVREVNLAGKRVWSRLGHATTV
ncbi:MAG: amidohydrolase family protein [Beijerinckiaceae bacterium]